MKLTAPMLASPVEFDIQRYPVLGFPKLDGIRAMTENKSLLSRTLKPIPNPTVRKHFEHQHYHGLDGELIVGSATDPHCFRNSTSGIMAKKGEPDFTYHVFDSWSVPGAFDARLANTIMRVTALKDPRIQLVMPTELRNLDDVLAFEEQQLSLGYEGLILRDPLGPYKAGRSTARQGWLLKLKRFLDSEAVVIDVVEEMFNGNEAVKDNLGRTKRSSSKEGKSGKGRMGTLVVRAANGVEFELGTGFTDTDKDYWWTKHLNGEAKGCLVKFKYFPVGNVNKPRHPVYLGQRHADDV